MSKFFESWKSFKDDVKVEKQSKLLKEFTKKDKQELLSGGNDFTVSYEIEMVSKDYIDSDGEIITPTSARDVSTMSSFDQVEYFNYHDNIEEQVRDEDAFEYLFQHIIYDYGGNRFDNLEELSKVIIASAKSYTLGQEYQKLTNNDIGSFLIAGYLDKNPQAELLIVNAEDSKQKIIDRIADYPAQNEDEKEEIQTFLNMANRTDDFSRDLALLLGLEGDDLTLDFSESAIDRIMLFEYIIDKKIEDKEVQDLNDVCKFLFKDSKPRLKDVIDAAINKRATKQVWDRYNKRYEKVRSPYADYQDFKEFNLALNSLSGRASDKISDMIEHVTNNFDYQDYSINLEDYNAYDSNEGQSAPYGASGENALDKFLPNFWSKYGNDMDTAEDLSLPKSQSIEIKMKTFITGLQDAVRYLDLFFQDFDKQNNFYFSRDTGLHTNVSINIPDKKFNVLKGLLFLSEEETTPGKVPYAYKGTETRFTSQDWSKPLKNKAFENIKQQISKLNKESKDRLIDAYKNNDFEFLSDYLNEMAKRFTHGVYVKGYGFNTQYTETRGYIEFRYPGHQLTKEDLVNLTLYYAYIVKLTLDPNFKKDEYNVRLVKLLQDVLPSTDSQSAFGDNLKEYRVFLNHAKKYAYKFEYEHDLKRALGYAKNKFAYDVFYHLRDDKGLPVQSFEAFVDGWPAVKSQGGAISVIENIIAMNPSLKEKIIQRFLKYKNIPAYLYCVVILNKYKNSDVKLFTAALGSIESVLNNVYHDLPTREVIQKLFSYNTNILPDIFMDIKYDLVNSFKNYYETHKNEFRYETSPQQQVSESVFDRYESMLNDLYEGRKLGKPSSETSLRDWFKRKGAPGKRGGWVDCNTCRNGKCSPCGRQGGENRSKYPRCRPTPSQCKGYKRRGSNIQESQLVNTIAQLLAFGGVSLAAGAAERAFKASRAKQRVPKFAQSQKKYFHQILTGLMKSEETIKEYNNKSFVRATEALVSANIIDQEYSGSIRFYMKDLYARIGKVYKHGDGLKFERHVDKEDLYNLNIPEFEEKYGKFFNVD